MPLLRNEIDGLALLNLLTDSRTDELCAIAEMELVRGGIQFLQQTLRNFESHQFHIDTVYTLDI